MITRVSHLTAYVLDQDAALRFYTEALGFEVRDDVRMDNGFRWLTVGPKAQPDMHVVLFSVKTGGLDPAVAEHLQAVLEAGGMGVGVLETNDCRGDYEQLSARGVEFTSPPQEQFYGIEATLRDNSGNWYSLTQRK